VRGKVKKSVEEIIRDRTKQKCYLIYEQSGDFSLVYGSFYRRVVHGNFYDLLISYHKGSTGWDFTDRHIRYDRNDAPESQGSWNHINEVKKEVIDIDTLYIDGVKQST